MNGNSPADDRRLDGKISRRDFLKLIFATPFAISLMPFTQLTRAFGSNASNDNVIGPYSVGGRVGTDGVSFVYPTKVSGFTWYLSPDGFDSHFVRGHGSA